MTQHQDTGVRGKPEGDGGVLEAAKFALRWFEMWEIHADHSGDFGGEHKVMSRLRGAIGETEGARG